jgi:hypothetical protein
MPSNLLDEEDLKSLKIPLKAEGINSLAKQYSVGQHAMSLRLMNRSISMEAV